MSAYMTGDDLEELPGVGPATAEKLRNNGYDRYETIAVASAGNLANEADIGENTAQDVISAARDEADVGGFSTGEEVLERRQKLGKIPTGVEEVDDLLGGGFEEGSLTQLYGEYATGKSQFTHQLCVNVQLPPEHGGTGKRAVYIDTEESYRPERIRQMVHGLDDEVLADCMERDGVDGDPSDEDAVDELARVFLSRVHSAQAKNSEMQIMLARENATDIAREYEDDDFPVGLLVVDSITGHFRAEYVGRGELADRQQQLGKHLDDLTEFASMFDAAVVMPNQVMADPDTYFGDPTKASGGNVLHHRSTFRAKLREGKGDKKVIKLDDAPDLPDGEAIFTITGGGLDSG